MVGDKNFFTFSLIRLRRYLVAGVLLWVPLVATIWVVKLLIGWMDRSLVLLPNGYQPENLLGFRIPGLGLLLTFVVLLITGFFVANMFGRKLLNVWERLLNRIPLVRSVYNGVKQITETVLSDTGRSFKKVMLVEYPRKGVWSIGFVTATELKEVQIRTEKKVVCVFIPTTPNPTSGLIVLVPEDELIELDMSVDDAVKMIISLGVIVPRWHGIQQANNLITKV